ncbi:MAG: signal recognition particle protein Srp54 [Nanoarchaeota archaeon]|nr:signal recognition particle protein Srp54 [Nanoarchaeota archaeon]MBU1445438.1 signal recognition particle protein Srp54 [Nanoarchaeota archaeon]MBU2420246.1 signal recognition particle protein Srp54 [Nanoarchaeota archaeon]MBU2474991.1 signal recognition particle protein Srp54 [Nanoarchaeota archaeon]
MVLDKLGQGLKKTLRKIAGSVFYDKKLVEDIVKDIQRALLAADVNVQLVFDLSKKIKERALEEKTPQGLDPREYLIKIVYEELIKFLGEEKKGIEIKKTPFKIIFVGLYGSGKTTTIGKLARYYAKRGNKVCAVGLDVHRPAAPEQLKQVCDNAGIKSFIMKGEKDPMKIWKAFEKYEKDYDVILIDTAGRDALSKDLIKEIKELNKKIKAEERILVMSADLGQAAQKQAEAFHESCDVTGVIITKLDGTAKGGGALTGASVTNAKIKFIGVGEKIDDLEEFNPEGFVSRMLGMGDIEALLEKAKEVMTEEQAQDMGKKFLKGDFNFLDLYEQMQAMSKMGPLNKLVDMIPGMGKVDIPKDMLNVQEGKLKRWKFIMQSMCKDELENPEMFNRTRIERIAKGSGTTSKEVRELLKQYRQSKKLVKHMKPGKNMDINKLMKKFKGKNMKGMKF